MQGVAQNIIVEVDYNDNEIKNSQSADSNNVLNQQINSQQKLGPQNTNDSPIFEINPPNNGDTNAPNSLSEDSPSAVFNGNQDNDQKEGNEKENSNLPFFVD